MTETLELPELLLHKVALCAADPSSWASITAAAHSTLNRDPNAAFELEWFLKWHPILLPHRPWQYAVLTWRRFSGAPARRIVQFMLRVLQAKQQHSLQQPEQQQPSQADPDSFAYMNKYANVHDDGQYRGSFPELQPLPSTMRRVQKLLAKQQATADMQALVLLCPCASALFAQYAARDRTPPNDELALISYASSSSSASAVSLLQRAIQCMPYPLCHVYFLVSSRVTRYASIYRMSCFAGVAAGQVPIQQWRLRYQYNQHTGCLLQLLLPYAVRYSNAACLRAIMLQHDPSDTAEALAPQHMTMAAGRSDPWAAGVVALLLQLLKPKQLKPSNMRPAYRAACISGHLPVLQQLLAHAAAAPQQHLPTLMQAVAGSGNPLVVELLLGDTQGTLKQLQLQQAQEQGPRQQQQQAEQVAAAVDTIRAAWLNLGESQQVEVFYKVLPPLQRPGIDVASKWQAWEAMQLHVADLLWQLLQPKLLPAPAVASNTTEQQRLSANSSCGILQREPLMMRSAGVGDSLAMVYVVSPAAWLWLWRHQVVSQFWAGLLNMARNAAVEVEHHETSAQLALQLHRLYPQSSLAPSPPSRSNTAGTDAAVDAVDAIQPALSVIQGRIQAACTACDPAALQSLELLSMLCYLLLTPPAMRHGLGPGPATTACTAPTLAMSPTYGRVVTVAHLSAALNLPWQLLGTLLQSAGYDQLHPPAAAAPTVMGATTSNSSWSKHRMSVPQQLEDAMVAVEDPQAAALQEGVVLCYQEPAQGQRPLHAASPQGQQEQQLLSLALQDAPLVLLQQQYQELLQLMVPQQEQDLQVVQHIFATRQYCLLPRAASVTPQSLKSQERLSQLLQQKPELVDQLQAAFDHGVQQLAGLVDHQQEQQQQGPPPLWQQALLQVVAAGAAKAARTSQACGQYQMFGDEWGGVTPPWSLALSDPGLVKSGLGAGRSVQEVQELISARLLLLSGTPVGPRAADAAPWGKDILCAALIHRKPELLAWSLQQERVLWLWGRRTEAVSDAVRFLAATEGCSPITCRGRRGRGDASINTWQGQQWLSQQHQVQQDLKQLHQQRENLLGPAAAAVNSSYGPIVAAAGPLTQFACSAVQLALLLLQRPGTSGDTLDTWLRYTLGVSSPLPDVVRARAIVAAVAAAEVIPPGARVLQREAVRQVLAVGDPDLWSVVLLWCHRLPIERPDDDEIGFPLGAADWDDDEQAAGIAGLAAAVDAVII